MARAIRIVSTLGFVDGLHMHKVLPPEILITERAEDVIYNRRRMFNRLVSIHRTRWFETCKRKRVDHLLERHAVLQRLRRKHSKTIQKSFEARAFFVHVDEDLA